MRFVDWANVYYYSKKYEGCIGNDTLESVSENIVRILADKWDQLPVLEKLVKNDKKFIIMGISSTVSGDNLLKIYDLAKKQCLKGLSTLCNKIGTKAIRAYKKMDEF